MEKMRAATYIAGMPSAKVKGGGAKHGAGRAASGLSLGMLLVPVYPQGRHQLLLPPDPAVQDLAAALSTQHTVLENPQP